MDTRLADLGARLREVDTFTALAGQVIEEVGGWPGVTDVAVEAHDGGGPFLWLASPGLDALAARRYLEGGHAREPLLARARAALGPVAADRGGAWLVPILGCGELRGAIRITGAAPESALGPVCALVSIRLAELGGPASGADVLTARQHEVVVLVARGATNPEIARLLAISPDAVKKHVSRALDALGVSNRAELAGIAGRWRCAPPPRLAPTIQVVRRADRWRDRALAA